MSVYVCVIPNDVPFERSHAALRFGKSEQARIDSLKTEQRRRESFGALVALDALLTDSETPLTLKRDENGKPRFEEGGMSLSLSHSESLSAAAITESDKVRVGLDVEHYDSRLFEPDTQKYKKIAARFFSEKERAEIEAKDNETDAERAFYKIWTAKEAYAKLKGDGLAHTLGKELPSRGFYFHYRELEYRGERYYLTACTDGKDEFSVKLSDGISFAKE
jgi:4'-phosphopantetheinyl transferase